MERYPRGSTQILIHIKCPYKEQTIQIQSTPFNSNSTDTLCQNVQTFISPPSSCIFASNQMGPTVIFVFKAEVIGHHGPVSSNYTSQLKTFSGMILQRNFPIQ